MESIFTHGAVPVVVDVVQSQVEGRLGLRAGDARWSRVFPVPVSRSFLPAGPIETLHSAARAFCDGLNRSALNRSALTRPTRRAAAEAAAVGHGRVRVQVRVVQAVAEFGAGVLDGEAVGGAAAAWSRGAGD